MASEHTTQLHLNHSLYFAQIALQNKEKLGKPYAGLKIFNEGAYALKLITKNEYETNKAAYSVPLTQNDPICLAPEELAVRQALDEKIRYFKMVLAKWDMDHYLNWKQDRFKEAEQYPDLAEAKAVRDRYLGIRGSVKAE